MEHNSQYHDESVPGYKPVHEILNNKRSKWDLPMVSTILPDDSVVEMVFDPKEKVTRLCLYRDEAVRYVNKIEIKGRVHVPYSANNNLVHNEIILFPSQATEYGTERELVAEIHSFIHRYVDIDSTFEHVAAYYVLLSWVYDAFNELPYLRIRGDYGTGKTRFLLTIGSLCYKPIFASGASTVSPLFRMLESFRGTLIVDEGDFRFSDERADLVKILNNGNARGFPVLRCETNQSREFNPAAYSVFGPKLVAMRGTFDDPALESRFLTHEVGLRPLRSDIALNLPVNQREEARQLRNKLLMFRFKKRHQVQVQPSLARKSVEPRLNQILLPLLSIIDDPEVRRHIEQLTENQQRQLIAERGESTEGQILGIIRDLVDSGELRLSIKAVTDMFRDRHGEDCERKVSNKWIGSIIRKKLNLRTLKSNGTYCLADINADVLTALYERYGV